MSIFLLENYKKSEGENMYFRLTQVDIQDGKMEDTLAYAASVMDSFKRYTRIISNLYR